MKKIASLWIKFHSRFLKRYKLKFITRFYKNHPGKYCWADCVAWAYGHNKFNPYKIDGASGCKIESEEGDYCYCGGWHDGKCWALITEPERSKMITEINEAKVDFENVLDEPPF